MNNKLSQFVTGDYMNQELNLTAMLSTPEFLAQIRAIEAGIRASIAKGEIQPCGICFNDTGLHVLMPTVESAEEAYRDMLKQTDVINVRQTPDKIASCSFPNPVKDKLNDQSFNIIMGAIFAQAIYGVLGVKAVSYEELASQAYTIFNRKIVLT